MMSQAKPKEDMPHLRFVFFLPYKIKGELEDYSKLIFIFFQRFLSLSKNREKIVVSYFLIYKKNMFDEKPIVE